MNDFQLSWDLGGEAQIENPTLGTKWACRNPDCTAVMSLMYSACPTKLQLHYLGYQDIYLNGALPDIFGCHP